MGRSLRYPEISSGVIDELKAFADKNGREWKSVLRRHWERAEPVPGFPSLYGLRNSHGPRWLVEFRFREMIHESFAEAYF